METVVTGVMVARDVNARWDRLQAVLIAAKPGETIRVDALTKDTGLERDTIVTVLKELTRVTLFEPQGDGVFIRRSLWPQS
jgi:hypothetical protein